MKNTILNLTVIAALGATFATSAFAANSAEQTVTYQVSAINELAVSGNPGALIVNAAVAGSAPSSVSDSSTSYSITTNEVSRKITGSIDSNMPSGLTLTVALVAPSEATSAGALSLSTVAVDLVTGIDTLNESAKGITYDLSATSAAGVVPSASKTVTLTITAGA